ncbi:MAG TPA: GFA family protein [Hyphomicrobiales bacterium]|nr:GFA family protein [Hyphomicrobiales bacterium]
MELEGSCRCGAVGFTVTADEPIPFMRCYCSICRKTAGGGGYAINLGARMDTLKILSGEDSIGMFHAVIDCETSPVERRFCKSCGTALWVWDPRWPELVHPFASAIDTPLPEPPANTHMMLDFAAPWVKIEAGPDDEQFARYPDKSLAEWHRAHGWPKDK